MKIQKAILYQEIEELLKEIHHFLLQISDQDLAVNDNLGIFLNQRLRQLEGMHLQFQHYPEEPFPMDLTEIHSMFQNIQIDLQSMMRQWQAKTQVRKTLLPSFNPAHYHLSSRAF